MESSDELARMRELLKLACAELSVTQSISELTPEALMEHARSCEATKRLILKWLDEAEQEKAEATPVKALSSPWENKP